MNTPLLHRTAVAALMAATVAGVPVLHAATPSAPHLDAPSATVALDPADSLYRAGREALTNGDYDRAAQLFHEVGSRYPKSTLLPDAMYYEAFARYRAGGAAALRAAHDILASLQKNYPAFGRGGDAATLSTRICGVLAQQGDASCAERIVVQASGNAGSSEPAHAAASIPANTLHSTSDCRSAGDDERIAALNALLQMDAARAEPILEKVLARRDECSATLRRKAVFLVAQKKSPQAADVLLHVAQSDPDARVRGQAVFWLSQVSGDRAVTVLSEILHNSKDADLRDKALFALGQSHDQKARSMLREFASDGSAPTKLRGTAVFWLGQQGHGSANAQFLRDLYDKTSDAGLKKKVMFSLSQSKEPGNVEWLLKIARNQSETVAVRKHAIFLAGTTGRASIDQLSRLYDSLPPGALRDQIIFAYSQMNNSAAVDKLITIARSDKDSGSRKKALFWLGQSHDPRAIKVITEVIDK